MNCRNWKNSRKKIDCIFPEESMLIPIRNVSENSAAEISQREPFKKEYCATKKKIV